MNIQNDKLLPSVELQEKINLFNADVKTIIPVLDAMNSSSSLAIKEYLALAAPSFAAIVESVAIDKIDRTLSMVCGPSFVSEIFPRPTDSNDDCMFPILQFNLAWINTVCDKTFDPGLLQLWWSPSTSEDTLRFIPADQIDQSSVCSIEITKEMIEAVEKWGAPYDWLADQSNCAYVIKQCVPIGMTYPEFEDLLIEFLNENELDSSSKSILTRLCSLSSYSSQVSNSLFNLFGNFSSPFGERGRSGSMLSTSQWCGDIMSANLYAYQTEETGKQTFDFDWGR